MISPKGNDRAKNDVVEVGDAATKVSEMNERQKEQEMIQKGITFWNHPALRDVPSSEKRLYLQEQQGLTNVQIHKVWEEIVGTPGTDNSSSRTQGNSTVPQHYTAHPQQHRYNPNHPFSSRPPTNPNFGQYFNSNEVPPYGYDYPNGQFPPLPNEDTDGTISVARGLSLLGVGGALGVTGAAAVRWLNGGSFELFPTPKNSLDSSKSRTTSTDQTVRRETNDVTNQCATDGTNNNHDGEHDEEGHEYNNAEYFDEDDEDDEEDEFDVEECLLERMDALLSSIDSNSLLQEKLIQKLANTSTITDDSMSLLKQNKLNSINTTGMSVKNTQTIVQLKEVKDGLADLCNSMKDGTKEDWYIEWSELLSKFNNCIQSLEEPMDPLDSDVADTKSISTSETTQTENRQDTIPSLPPAPTTPAASNESGISSSDMTATLMPLSLNDSIVKLVEKNNPTNLKTGSQLLYLYLANLSGKPDNRRYRKIFTSNESFARVEKLIGGKELLCAVGFVEDEGVLEWVPTGCTDEEISALILVKEAAAALGVLKKPDNRSASELVRLALSKLSSSLPRSLSSSPPVDEKDQESGNQGPQEDIPQTPVGSSLLSPPMPKKMSFAPTPSDNLK